jgi:hypothetical protein
VWLPRFVCPECHVDLDEAGDVRACVRCGRSYGRENGVWRFLSATCGLRLEPFARQYRAIRDQEGRISASPEYYRQLPSVKPDDPHAGEWRIRRETYHHLLQHVLAAGPQPVQVLDLGAGTGWLSHRLSALGHDAVAVDAIDDMPTSTRCRSLRANSISWCSTGHCITRRTRPPRSRRLTVSSRPEVCSR